MSLGSAVHEAGLRDMATRAGHAPDFASSSQGPWPAVVVRVEELPGEPWVEKEFLSQFGCFFVIGKTVAWVHYRGWECLRRQSLQKFFLLSIEARTRVSRSWGK